MIKIFNALRFYLFKLKCVFSTTLIKFVWGIKGDIKFHGFAKIELYDKNSLFIGDGTLINSSNDYYHVAMYSKCKLVANTPDAKIIIGKNSRIHGSCLSAKQLITIGDNVLIAGNCNIFDSNGHEVSLKQPMNRIFTTGKSQPIKVGDGVWIGANVIVTPGVTIGDGCVVAAGSVVTKSFPENVLLAGNPARKIREINCYD
tara:strand:- start:10558 stop:11160 length:603 start_codon:yes stop_codon:yes gene_type:complete